MKDNNSHGTSEKNLAVWNDPELEVRLIAMLMGELSPFEEADMKQELERSPELRLFRDRMIKVMGLVTEVNQQDANTADDDHNDDGWSLSPERRSILLENFAEGKSKGKSIPSQASFISTAKIQWRNVSSIAACLLVSLVAFKMMFVRKNPLYKMEAHQVTYSAATELENELKIIGQREVILGGEKSSKSHVYNKSEYKDEGVVTPAMEFNFDTRTPPPTFRSANSRDLKGQTAGLDMNQERVIKAEMSNEVAQKPSAPTSSLAKVIAAGAPGSEHIPVPEVAVNEPSLDYGDGDAFDDGFGKGSGNGGGRQAAEKGREVLKGNQRSKLAQLNGPTGGKSSEADPFGDDAFVDSIEDKLDIPTPGTRGNLTDVTMGGIKKDLAHELAEGNRSGDLAITRDNVDSFLNNPNPSKNGTDIINAKSANSGTWNEYYKSGILPEIYSEPDDKLSGVDKGRKSNDEKLKSWLAAGQPSDSDITLKGDRQNSGSDDTNSLISKEIARRELQIDKADENLKKGREAQRGEDYETAVTKYKEALDQLPQGSIAREKREAYTKDLVDSSLALSEQYRRTGKYDIAEKLLDEVLEKDSGNVAAKKQLEYLDDPIRTSPTFTYDHVQNVEKVRKLLYRASSYYDQAQFDQANEEYKEVLRTDPHNMAARRGMEKVDAAKSDFYRVAYKLTKAAMLMDVDQAWEITAPPAEVGAKLNALQKPLVTNKIIPDFTKEIAASEQTHSTFSLNVSDVSYQLAKSVLLENSGVLEADKIRVEEFVNAFDYGDPSAGDKKVNCVVEQCAHPFYQQRNLIRVGMKTGAMGRTQPLRLTILLDNSGSMEREDRAATVVKAMEALAKQLGPQDEVTLMSFARDARLLAQKVKGNEAMQLVDMVKSIPSEGGTNLSRAIEQAYGVAQQSVQEGTMSRIVVITDGAANLGNANPEDLAKSIEQMRQNGIAFDACGVGADGLDDDMLEALTRKGDGRYYFINRPEDADAGFAQKLAGALRPSAKNVKVQVVFNPERVGNYRLIGFEKHRLEKEDFRNDAVDAAEMAAEEAGNALYQVEARPDGKGDVATVFVRFQDMASGQMVERSWSIPYQSNVAGINSATPSMQLATAAGMLGERLKLGEQAGIDLKELNPIFAELRSHYHSDQEVKDLIRMCEKVSE